ncbi:hypothetical protein M409DRAFT_62990 [Zasmidium cellare ATCC 36951]|uniref:Major facilitator superfamily (MFS) profile domain-containing protein n=1 Tax=Zasmidium cellare ATCC 36951 TaxID=1080233 RepID=A0A6A6CYH0_ZASCE|nr:uncharacterized protein M409DRAFT_62990 [Zasmidium cellare ATCC 36951]KAF2172234.1 hypothetical protein M409DRAFT_62990 [Zasmidium cellare ATCC 36951]
MHVAVNITSPDDDSRPKSAGSTCVQELDSAATTLIASGKRSFGEGKSYADVELEAFEEREKVRKRRRSWDSGGKSDGEDDEDEDEDERLLARTASTGLPDEGEPAITEKDDRPVSWSSLPKKSQLAILTLARLSEPLTQTSLQSYMFYQLKSFKNPDGSTPSDSTVASQAGLLAAAFTGAQFTTAIMWGRLADWEGLGRKRVILIGLLGTTVGSLGFGFSESFAVAIFWRFLGGMLNGNMGVMRTMISEIVKEKRFQSRAFLLLPMTFNIGVIVGPLLGGLLADPVGSYPGLFGPGGAFGGENGNWLFTRWPYALPNLVNATFLAMSALALIFGLEETLESLRDKPDYGLRITRWIGRNVFRRQPRPSDYDPIMEQENPSDIEMDRGDQKKTKTKAKLPFRRIWTPNLIFTLIAHGLLAMHVGTFNNLWFVFLSTPRYNPDGPNKTLHLPDNWKPHLPFSFTGGLALPPASIGMALAILGTIGITLQLALYPRLSFRLGTLLSYRLALLFFPLTYLCAPFLAIIPSTAAPPTQASGPWLWIYLTFILCIQLMGRTFALPSAAILVNNASPHPSVLGTVHGVAQTVSSATRTLGPVLAGWIYGVGLNKGIVGLAWWCMAGVAVLGNFAGRWVRDGDGHEIWLEGDEDGEEKGRR